MCRLSRTLASSRRRDVSDYRLLFVSYDVVQATSLNIGDYDTFVTNEAAMNAALPSTTWSAIVSTAPGANGTPGVSAVDHVSCGASCDANVPIFLVDGTPISQSTNAFFAADIANPPAVNQFGDFVGNEYVWTGSNLDGTAATPNEAGSSTGYTVEGTTDFFPETVLDFDAYHNTAFQDVYAISGDILAPVPEPVTGSVLLLGGAVVTRVLRRRRRL